jgi:hypothetical protein
MRARFSRKACRLARYRRFEQAELIRPLDLTAHAEELSGSMW